MEKERFIFDLDGTLLSGDYKLEEEYFQSIYGEDAFLLLGNISQYLNEYENIFSTYDKELLAKFLSKKSGLRVTPSIVHGWIRAVSFNEDKVEAGVGEALEYFKGKDKSLVVLTNWFGDTQIPRLKRAGLYPYFDEIYTGDVCLKPHKEAYMMARGVFLPEECVFIGDSIDKDYVGPRANGMDSVLYDPGDVHHSNLVKVKKMKELIRKY